MAKYFVMMVALIVAFDSLVAPKLLANAGQMKCADVLKNPNEVHRELSSRNLNGNKIIKFIENCIKSVDGWRFKKSGSGHVSIGSNTVPGTSAIQSTPSMAPSINMAFEYFPAMLHDSSAMGSLPSSASASSTLYSPSSSPSMSTLSSRLSELANLEKHFRHFYGPMFYAKMSNLLAEQQQQRQQQQAQQAQQRQLEAEQLEQEHPTLNSNSNSNTNSNLF